MTTSRRRITKRRTVLRKLHKKRKGSPLFKGTPGQFKAMIVRAANANNALMDGTPTPVQRIVDENDLVYAVWQDRKQPDGIGIVVIKGESLLADKTNPIPVKISAIACADEEQALVACAVFGDRPN